MAPKLKRRACVLMSVPLFLESRQLLQVELQVETAETSLLATGPGSATAAPRDAGRRRARRPARGSPGEDALPRADVRVTGGGRSLVYPVRRYGSSHRAFMAALASTRRARPCSRHPDTLTEGRVASDPLVEA